MVKYKVNQKDTSVNGTSLKGYLETTYDRLVELFGEPKKGSADGKTTCEWLLEFEDGIVATIHDWKVESTPKNLYNWSVGGHSYKVLDLVTNVTNIKTRILEF